MSRDSCWTAAAMCVVIALAACAPTRPASEPSPAPTAGAGDAAPDGLTASLVQYRRDQPRRFVEVKLDNSTGDTLDITLVDVDLPGFGPSGPVGRDTNLKADRRVDLPVPLGEALCEQPPGRSAAATIEISGPGGRTVRSTLPVDDDGLLTRLHTFDCAVRRANEAADIMLRPSWRQRGQGRGLDVAGQASVALRDPAARVEVTDITGGILFIAQPETITPTLPVRIDDRRPTVTLRFALLPARCDGHAIAEAKRLTTVTFLVAVDGAEAVPIRRAPGEDGFETLLAALNERCAGS